MLATFESILPIFLLILAGNLLRRLPIIDSSAWPGIEQIGFWFLYPALLFTTIANADFSGLALNAMMSALLVAIAVMGLATYALWWPLSRTGLVTEAQFSSVFQTALRWNGFMALAIAQKIFPPAGMAVVALVMAAIIIPVNLASIYVLITFSGRGADWKRVARGIATNPLILASLTALLVRLFPNGLYAPINQTIELAGEAALGMGLVAIGTGLRLGDLFRPSFAVWLPVVLKLIVFPVLLISIAISFSISGQQLQFLALCAAVPTALNGYLLARQLGGDAELYAAVTTMQTVVSFITIPAVLALTSQFAG